MILVLSGTFIYPLGLWPRTAAAYHLANPRWNRWIIAGSRGVLKMYAHRAQKRHLIHFGYSKTKLTRPPWSDTITMFYI